MGHDDKFLQIKKGHRSTLDRSSLPQKKEGKAILLFSRMLAISRSRRSLFQRISGFLQEHVKSTEFRSWSAMAD